MISIAVLLMSLTSPPAAAHPRDCVNFLLRPARAVGRWIDDWSWRQVFPDQPVPTVRDWYREQLARDTASVRAAFERMPAGVFKTRLAIREIDRSVTELKKFAADLHPCSLEAWHRVDVKERQGLYYEHLIRLYYLPGERADLLALPGEVIRDGARAIAVAEASEGFSKHNALRGWFPLLIDVEPILAEKANRPM